MGRPMLAPSLLAPGESYEMRHPEKVMTDKKRTLSPPLSSNSDSQENLPGRPRLEKRLSETITSEISLDNLVEGSRRKRNKFSSDLPLLPLPTPKSAIHSFGHARSMSGVRNRADSASTTATSMHTPFHSLARVSFPTPAPTTISDEDVAMQLIRLGDPSLSPFKCPSDKSSSPVPALTTAMQLKTLHDSNGFHDKQAARPAREVEYPSSPPSSVNENQDLPLHRGTSHTTQFDDQQLRRSELHRGDCTAADREAMLLKEETDVEEDLDVDLDIPRPQNLPDSYDLVSGLAAHVKHSHSSAPDDEELPKVNGRSVGIRCTRCKKSKKGCDRQRPCGRCADANEDCVTEDESTNRRGRTNRGRGKKR